MESLGTHYLEEVRRQFRGYKRLVEGAIAQISDEELFRAIDPEANSIAVIMKHMAGNLRSRFRDFMTSDGEKPDRNREQEFVSDQNSRVDLLKLWEHSWGVLFDTLESLTPADLECTVTIRAEPHSVLQALNRQVAHHAYHAGQIVFLAKHFRGSQWNSLSIPKGQSEKFNAEAVKKFS
ncbi:MAG: DUF1572 family protein [Candidatus Korobacteraceae bacterium]